MTRTLPTPPPRIAKLPVDRVGRPVPWFVAWVDGVPDFRVVGPGKLDQAVEYQLCWLCGQHRGANAAFVLGPMCSVNRVSPEPPSHRDCAIYAATACPFLTTPGMRRRDNNLPEGASEPDGEMIRRNPGVALVWITRTWHVIPGHRLFSVGDPTETLWYANGRPASRAEVMAAIESGLPILQDSAAQETYPQRALEVLRTQYEAALQYVPGGAR